MMESPSRSPVTTELVASSSVPLLSCAEKEQKQLTPGIVYFSSIPPYMRPLKIRHVFSRYGDIGRVYLQPEDPLVHKRRRKLGGNKRKKFTEGWVEFSDKRVARRVAATLNNCPVGGKKSSYYHDDIWNIKYLSKFRWTHLTEKIAYENAVREQRLRTEISQAKRENTHYLQSVEKGHAVSAIVEKKKRTGRPLLLVDQDPLKKFKQRKVEKSLITPTESITSSTKDPILSDSLLKKVLP